MLLLLSSCCEFPLDGVAGEPPPDVLLPEGADVVDEAGHRSVEAYVWQLDVEGMRGWYGGLGAVPSGGWE